VGSRTESHTGLTNARRDTRCSIGLSGTYHRAGAWAKPIVVDNLYHNYFQPACKALGLGSVRFHDLRHTFATLALSAGEHYMQVSKWLGHSSFVLTLSTYADYITEDELAAPKLARPVVAAADNVVSFQKNAWSAIRRRVSRKNRRQSLQSRLGRR
jgi:Phage integrase family